MHVVFLRAMIHTYRFLGCCSEVTIPPWTYTGKVLYDGLPCCILYVVM